MNSEIDPGFVDFLLSTSTITQAPQNQMRAAGLTPGCYSMVITDEIYHRQCIGASSSSLKKMLRSPAHYKAYKAAKDQDSPARRFGRAVHAMCLEPQTFDENFVVWRDGRRSGKSFGLFTAESEGKTILSVEDYERVKQAVQALRDEVRFPMSTWLDGIGGSTEFEEIPPAKAEFSIFWIDEMTGIQCKARVDAHAASPNPVAIDLKTTDDARIHSFTAQFFKLDYDLQAAHYSAALKAYYGIDFAFLFAVVEAQSPFATNVFGLAPEVLENGEAKRRYALDTLKKCQDTDTWPAYAGTSVEGIEMPYYQAFQAPNS